MVDYNPPYGMRSGRYKKARYLAGLFVGNEWWFGSRLMHIHFVDAGDAGVSIPLVGATFAPAG